MGLSIEEQTSDFTQRELAQRKFEHYCEYVHNFKLFRHMKVWAEHMVNPEMKRIAIVAPPESFKSTLCRWYLEWSIGNNPDVTTLLVMNTAAQAERQIMSIQETIESNEKYKKVFPEITPDKDRGWSKSQIFVKRPTSENPDATIYGVGIEGPYQGVHVHQIVVDDATDQKDVTSPATMGAQRNRLQGVLIDRLHQDGKFFSIMTRWGESDLLSTFKEMGFLVIENYVEGHYPWGRLLCPELFPDERLREIRATKGGPLYDLTYMGNTASAEGALLKREWWRYYTARPRLEKNIISWDLSTGTSDLSDFTAWQEWAIGEDGYYLLDAGKERLDMDGVIRKMELLYAQKKPTWMLVEEAGTSIPVLQNLRRHTRMPVKGIKPGHRDKVSRVRSIQHLVEAGRVWVPSTAFWIDDFIDEMSRFPGGPYDDQVDAMSQALSYLLERGIFSDSMPVSLRLW